MFKLRIQPEAARDLLDMKNAGGKAATCALRIAAILGEIRDTPSLMRQLTTNMYDAEDFEIGKFLNFWNDGIDLWKLKIFDFDQLNDKKWPIPYRVLYAYDVSCYTYRILGVLPRSFNYDPDHELTKRIIKTYNDLGLPKHKVSHRSIRGNNNLH